jgi:protocatechuate 3,4-dioxygenase beta subunit
VPQGSPIGWANLVSATENPAYNIAVEFVIPSISSEVRMMRHKPALAAMVIALSTLLSSQTVPPNTPPASPATQQQKEPEPCTVSGRVVSAAEGTPIQSARVGLIQADVRERPAVYGTTTDDQGHFEIKKVPAGRYRFVASRAGFIGQEYGAKGLKGGAALSLSPGQTIDDAMFRLTRAAVVSGRVLDEAGEPMLGVYVSALRKLTAEEIEDSSRRSKRESLLQSSGTVTDDRGEYRIFGLKPGEYYLKATENPDEASMFNRGMDTDLTDYELVREMASQYAPLYYPGVLQAGEAQPVQLRAGEEVQADLAMRHIKTVQVSGHVVAADGKPATHAFVTMRVPDAGDFASALSGTTDEKGEFIIKGVAPGSYVVSAQQRTDNRRDTAHQKLDVGESNLENVVLSFGAGITINGRITATGSGVALDRAHVVLSPLDEDAGSVGAWSEVKSDGTFEITNVADGSYILRAGVGQKGWYVQSARLGAADVLQKGVQIERGTAAGTLELVLSSEGAQLDGTVTQDNKPVVGAQIRARPEPQTPYNEMRGTFGVTDQNGQFTIPTVPPGKYKVIAKLLSGSPEVPALTSEPQIVTLGEHDHQTLQLTLPKPEQ